jgi:membrane protease YdiL (CAAX protease family)
MRNARAAAAFTLLTFVASWLLWAASAAVQGGRLSQAGFGPLDGTLYILGVFAPAIVALALTAGAEGRAGVQTLLRRMTLSSVGWRWYAFAVTYYAAIKAVVALVYRAAFGAWPAFSPTPWFLMLAAVVFSTPVQAGEEIGWRGCLLPRLSEPLGLPAPSLVVGVVWAAWHLPFFAIAGTDKTGQPFPAYLVGVTGLSVTMA